MTLIVLKFFGYLLLGLLLNSLATLDSLATNKYLGSLAAFLTFLSYMLSGLVFSSFAGPEKFYTLPFGIGAAIGTYFSIKIFKKYQN
jgi:hypothetical protein